MKNIETIRQNNFNLLRFIAASLVVYSHSWSLIYGPGVPDKAWPILPFGFGTLAVYAFFGISGFLVTKSLMDRKNIIVFIKARLLRIYPALALSVLACALIVGPLFSSLSTQVYFENPAVGSFISQNLLFPGLLVQSTLPGVFLETPIARAVNDPLWTIPYELLMYGVLATLCLFRLAGGRKRMIASLLLLLIISAILRLSGLYLMTGIPGHVWYLFIAFLYGGLLYLIEKPQIHGAPAALFWVLLSITLRETPFFVYSAVIATVTVCIWFAFFPITKLWNFNKIGDASYGMYIYVFPIQQITALFLVTHGIKSPIILFILSIIFGLLIGLLSWHYFEEKILRFKSISILRELQNKFRRRS